MKTSVMFRASAACALALVVGACGAPGGTKAVKAAPEASTPANSNTRVEKSRDGSYSGEVIGTPAPNSKFAKLKIGMNMAEVQDILDRAPDRTHSYESGKRWIPFYFGNDARRLQAMWKGEGCLMFTNGNVWGGSGGDLIGITHDKTGACYQP